MINGLENLIQTGFFSSSYTSLSLSLLVGGAGCCCTLVPEHIISTEHCKPETFTRIPSQKRNKKPGRHSQDSRKGNKTKLKGNEGLKEGKE